MITKAARPYFSYCYFWFLVELIEVLVGDWSRFGVQLSYSFVGSKLLVTGGVIIASLYYSIKIFMEIHCFKWIWTIENSYLSRKKGLITILKNVNQWHRVNIIYKKVQLLVVINVIWYSIKTIYITALEFWMKVYLPVLLMENDLILMYIVLVFR